MESNENQVDLTTQINEKKLSDVIFNKVREEFYPDEISWQEKVFGKKTGYDEQKVETFLEEVMILAKHLEAENEQLLQEYENACRHFNLNGQVYPNSEDNEELREKLFLADEALREVEGMIETHREILKDAAIQKERVIKHAKEEGEEIKRRATREGELRLRDLNKLIDEKERTLIALNEKEQLSSNKMADMVDMVEQEIKSRLSEVVAIMKDKMVQTNETSSVQNETQAEA